MNDLISRQKAIDAINTWDKFGVDERSRIARWHEGLEPYVHLRDVLTAIVNLPSAQPERITLTEEEQRMYKKLRTFHNGSYAKLLDKLFASAQPEVNCQKCIFCGFAGFKQFQTGGSNQHAL